MNRIKIKYWGKRLRLLGDVLSGAIATIAIAYAGIASGNPVVENLPLAAIGLLLALVIWLSVSFISGEMDDGDD